MPPFIASATNAKHIRAIADMLNACSIAKTVTYQQMTRAIGKDVRTVPYILGRARRLSNEETGAVFKTVRGTGCERMPANQAPSIDNTFRAHVRKGARGVVRMLSNAMEKANDLTPDEVRRGWQAITHQGMIGQLAQDRSAPKMPDSILPPDPAKTARDTLEAMRGALGRRG